MATSGVLVDIGRSAREAFFMFWETLWPIVLGFGLSGAIQAFLSGRAIERQFGDASALRHCPRCGLRNGIVIVLVRRHRHGQIPFCKGCRFHCGFGVHVCLHQSGSRAWSGPDCAHWVAVRVERIRWWPDHDCAPGHFRILLATRSVRDAGGRLRRAARTDTRISRRAHGTVATCANSSRLG